MVGPVDVQALRNATATDWVPDPWSWQLLADTDERWMGSVDADGIHLVEVPFVGNRRRVVPILHPRVRVPIEGVGARIAWSGRSGLRDGVFGYRATSRTVIADYRTEYRLKQQAEASHRRRAQWVASADVTRFFASTPAAWLLDSVSAFALPEDVECLSSIAHTFESELGYSLPEGYDASRALANFCLAKADSTLSGPFTRWIDDYRVFTGSRVEGEAALAELKEVLAGSPYRLGGAKSEVLPISETPGCAGGSLLDEHPEVGDVRGELERLADEWSSIDSLARERRLRHFLRLAAERCEEEALEPLARLVELGLPDAAVPRLAWYLAVVPARPGAESILAQLLQVDDAYANWRTFRLAPALWYFPTEVAVRFTDLVVKRAEASWPVWISSLRPLAKHDPSRLAELRPRDGDAYDGRAWGAARHEAQGSLGGGPPMRTYL